ncbi:hypothetical protein [Neotabrizicola sp. VNH66]|uniref:hypothetical protein n=1 Tax=Neotabrizicola sp. VNH66 TaxID=3400918 RepID=UPI003C04AA7D
MRNPAESQDEYEDEEGRIWPVVKLTPYDKRRLALRELEAKRDTITAKGELTAEDQTRLAVLAPLIDKAQALFDREGQRAKDDTSRKHRGIDKWRAGDGREQRNQSRRKVRAEPNADLSELTPEQKNRRKLDQVADSRWMKRKRADGWPEPRIQAELVVRIRQREADRADKAQVADDEAAMRADPNFGKF